MDWPIPADIPRAALVTGGAKRIGRAMVEALAAQGFAVAIHYRSSRKEAEALLADIGGRGCVVEADLAQEAEVLSLAATVERELGPMGVLVNNASVFERDEWNDTTRESWDRHLEPNLRAPFVLTQAFANSLPKEAHGMVLNILDQRVWNLTPHFISYTVSKSALWTLTQSLALALAPRIRVNAIGPGPVLPAPGQSDAHFNTMRDKTPLGIGATPEEIARAALSLLCLPSVTGQMVALDGGQHLQWRA
ncbi:SDR family oxidoreductase [Kozakia baliensis]|uniref:Short-chain dehydrogenase n=1 Tax=Kozakia baliensis TaxID=153496 RepID=A0A1D8URE2_9PROT|nr:SDR family oxidoreductase [Kozakia baliensis]AOX16204.1 short-chain dehydrogenase [Kozakia baliensis]GEL63757.1 short chain dehydrogenase [Kozakia baliensis]